MTAPQSPTRLGSSTDFGGLKRGQVVVFFGARRVGKSIAHLIGKPLLPFDRWKAVLSMADSNLQRSGSEWRARYEQYARNWATANPTDLQPLPPTVDPSQQKGNE